MPDYDSFVPPLAYLAAARLVRAGLAPTVPERVHTQLGELWGDVVHFYARPEWVPVRWLEAAHNGESEYLLLWARGAFGPLDRPAAAMLSVAARSLVWHGSLRVLAWLKSVGALDADWARSEALFPVACGCRHLDIARWLAGAFGQPSAAELAEAAARTSSPEVLAWLANKGWDAPTHKAPEPAQARGA